MSQSTVQRPSLTSMQRVYVWELPVRLYHWVNALCILMLIATGLLISYPLNLGNATDASLGYWFGWVRFLHFVTAYVFLFNFLFRIYWGFVGNKYASWRTFIPFRRAQWKEIKDVVKTDVLLAEGEHAGSTGHNSLAGLTYFILFLVFLFQCATGFGMYAAMSDAWIPQLFAWVVPLMGGDFATRQWHHLIMWVFILFTVIHVYLVFYHDYTEGRGTMSSMVGGWKFTPSSESQSRDDPPTAETRVASPGPTANERQRRPDNQSE